jgi:hypothetical protein
MRVVFTVLFVKPRKKNQAFPGLSGIGVRVIFTSTIRRCVNIEYPLQKKGRTQKRGILNG